MKKIIITLFICSLTIIGKSQNPSIKIGDIEHEDFNQTTEKITADDILDEINNKGYATLYINFRPDKSRLNGDSYYTVIEIAKMMKANPELNISIEGHTDNTGNATSNMKLSKKRAHAIFITLIMENINNSRLKNKGFGQTKPIKDNSTEEGRAKNTRIVIRKI